MFLAGCFQPMVYGFICHLVCGLVGLEEKVASPGLGRRAVQANPFDWGQLGWRRLD
jgi:hypothetical protein